MTNDLHDLLEAAIIILDDAVSGKNEHVKLDKNQIKSVELPKPCNGPLYAGWSPANYLCKVVEEIGEVGEAFDAYDRDPGDMEKWGHLMEECCDGIVALTGLMDCLGCDEGTRQFFMRGVNKSNATRDGGKRFKE